MVQVQRNRCLLLLLLDYRISQWVTCATGAETHLLPFLEIFSSLEDMMRQDGLSWHMRAQCVMASYPTFWMEVSRLDSTVEILSGGGSSPSKGMWQLFLMAIASSGTECLVSSLLMTHHLKNQADMISC
ncbi:uncharacterized protein LOC119592558 [Penaeus monodon]|uniref:uncharacterized protein LOC119592558 n=1 Tax=Penaeus monodon TaxID=6687 RepID=UPI0018A7A7E1|nr:uncharacterized protein LOC119592558 [Penaeus monodon]